jgi:hypothetical protein
MLQRAAQDKQGSTAAHRQLAAVGIHDGKPTGSIRSQVDSVLPDLEPPGLRVVRRRRAYGITDGASEVIRRGSVYDASVHVEMLARPRDGARV